MNQTLPQDNNAEQSVLGAIMVDNTKIYNAMEILKEDDFYKTAHRLIYVAMVELSVKGNPIDSITLKNQLQGKNHLVGAGGVIYLHDLLNGVPTAENIKYYIDIVKEKSLLRKLIIASQQIISKSNNNIEIKEVMGYAQEVMFDCFKDEQNDDMRFYSMNDLIHDTFTYIEELYHNKGNKDSLKTGFIDLDNLLGGLQKGELYTVAGDTSQGKTAFVLNIAYRFVSQKIPIAFFSVEMSKENLLQRLLCSEARIDYLRLKQGYIGEDEWAKLTTIAGQINNSPLFINDFSTPTVYEIVAMARKMVLHKGVKLIIIDFLQQLHHTTKNKDSETKQVTDDVKIIKGLAKSLKIPVILLSSLSRRKNYKEPPNLSLLRQSGAIESLSDTVMFVYRPEVYAPTPENEGLAEIRVDKQRNGPTGVVNLAFIKKYSRFENLSKMEGNYNVEG